MNAPSDPKRFDTKPLNGLMLVAAFRAERLGQRPVPRDSPPQYPPAEHQPVAPPYFGTADAPPRAPARLVAAADSPSVFASLVSLAAAAERGAAAAADQDRGSAASDDDRSEADRGLNVQAAPDETKPVANEPGENTRVDATSPPAAPDTMPSDTMPSDTMPSDTGSSDARGPAPASLADASPPHDLPLHDPPLAEIGFGPGMLIRLSQLGLHTAADLARADPGQLRVALGDISRLVDVETWITHARQTARHVSS